MRPARGTPDRFARGVKQSRSRWLAGGAAAAIAVAGGGFWFVAYRTHDPAGPSVSSVQPPSYSAEVHRSFTGPEGEFATDEVVAYSSEAARHEWTASGRRFATITRQGTTWLLDLDRNAYAVVRAPDEPATGALNGDQIEALVRGDDDPGSAEPVAVEEARLDGHPCRLVRARLVGLGGETSESAVWSALDLGGLAIRSELTGPDGARSVIELRRISLEPDPKLFELPPGAIADPGLAPR